ncbi:MAG TPA: glycoside hydrolase domain-containing protein [Terracidiphilus sp.]|nr:glycoside hydrolase domain-containing protein [Terracidiphilus sp.]
MALPGTIQAAATGLVGFDTDTVVSESVARLFADEGFRFSLRYLSLGSSQDAGDLSPSEAEDMLSVGLALMPVQHAPTPGWSPTGELGQAHGANAAGNAASIGFPQGVNVWCDLEGVNSASSAEDVIDYCTAWFSAVAAAGFVPGLYVGFNPGLTGEQLYDLPFEHYWQSASAVPAIPQRGYQMVQNLVSGPINGIDIDGDRTQTDEEGGQALWLSL